MSFKPTIEERKMAISIRKVTGKKMATCYFCVRYNKGNYQKALKMCSNNSKEGERRKAA